MSCPSASPHHLRYNPSSVLCFLLSNFVYLLPSFSFYLAGLLFKVYTKFSVMLSALRPASLRAERHPEAQEFEISLSKNIVSTPSQTIIYK